MQGSFNGYPQYTGLPVNAALRNQYWMGMNEYSRVAQGGVIQVLPLFARELIVPISMLIFSMLSKHGRSYDYHLQH